MVNEVYEQLESVEVDELALKAILNNIRYALEQDGYQIIGRNTDGIAAEKDGEYKYMRKVEDGFVAFTAEQLPEEGVFVSSEEVAEKGLEVLKSL